MQNSSVQCELFRVLLLHSFIYLFVCNKINKFINLSLFFKYNVFSSTGDLVCFEYNDMGLKL